MVSQTPSSSGVATVSENNLMIEDHSSTNDDKSTECETIDEKKIN